MANEVKILISAVDKASATLNKVQNELKQTGQTGQAGFLSMGKAALGAIGGIAAVGAAVGTAAKFVQGSIDDWANYNEEIRKLSIATGAAPEAFSRLIQAADDTGVSIQAMETSLRLASRQMPITIDSIANLSDELLGMNDITERNTKMQKLFGRGWSEITPFILSGSDAIRAGTGAIADNLIATEESIAASRAYKASVDNLADSWTGLRNVLGQEAMPALTQMLNELNDYIVTMQKGRAAQNDLANAVALGLIPMKDYQKALDQVSMKNVEYYNQLATKAVPIMEQYRKTYQDILPDMNEMVRQTKRIGDASGETEGDIGAMTAVIASGGVAAWEASDAFRAMADGIARANGTALDSEGIYQSATGELGKYTEQATLMTAAQIALDLALGKTTPEMVAMNVAIDNATKLLAGGVISIEQWVAVMGGLETGTMDAAAAVRALNGYLKSLPEEKRISIYVDTYGTTYGTKPEKTKFGGEEKAEQLLNPGEKKTPGGAKGLNMIVPPGYPNDTFPVLASSGEQVIITPKGNGGGWASGNNGGGGSNITVNVYPTPGQSETAIANAVIRKINQSMRAGSRSGLGYTG